MKYFHDVCKTFKKASTRIRKKMNEMKCTISSL